MANNMKWLLVLLALAAGAAIYVAYDRQSPAVEATNHLLPNWQNNPELINSFNQVLLTQNGEVIQLRKSGNQWILNDGFYADQAPLFQLVSGLSNAVILEPKTALAKNHPQLELAADDLKVEVFNDSGLQAAVHLGKLTNGGAQFVRMSDSDQTYTVTALNSVRFDENQWRLNTVMDVPPEAVVVASYSPQESVAFAVRRDLESQQLEWIDLAEGMQLKPNVYLDQLASGLSKLLIEEATPKSVDQEQLVTQINYELSDGNQVTLNLYRDGESDWLTIDSNVHPEYADWQFKVAEYKAKALNRLAEEFVEPLAEEAAEKGARVE